MSSEVRELMLTFRIGGSDYKLSAGLLVVIDGDERGVPSLTDARGELSLHLDV